MTKEDIDYKKNSKIGNILMKAWTTLMIFVTVSLGFFAFVLNDSSIAPYVALGVAGLCMPLVFGVFGIIARNKRAKEELEELKHELKLKKIHQERESERERLLQQEMYAHKEEAEQEALKKALGSFKVNK